jgi:hypothetical protein
MSKIKISPIEETEAAIELESDSHEPDAAAGPVERPIEIPIEIPIEKPAPKTKRVRKRPEPPTEPPPPPPTEPPPKPEPKKGKTITCNHCGKQILEKTFKYYHQLKCKPRESTPPPIKPQVRPESITVEFGFQRRAKLQEKYANLVARAF